MGSYGYLIPIPENPIEIMDIGLRESTETADTTTVRPERTGHRLVAIFKWERYSRETRSSDQISLQRMRAINVQKCPNNLRFRLLEGYAGFIYHAMLLCTSVGKALFTFCSLRPKIIKKLKIFYWSFVWNIIIYF